MVPFLFIFLEIYIFIPVLNCLSDGLILRIIYIALSLLYGFY